MSYIYIYGALIPSKNFKYVRPYAWKTLTNIEKDQNVLKMLFSSETDISDSFTLVDTCYKVKIDIDYKL